jgi:hypothetical protein
MKEYQGWPGHSMTLLAKKANRSVLGQDYVDWAVQALTEGLDSPSFLILAGLDIGEDFPLWEAEKYFTKAVNELGLSIPDDETILRKHLVTLLTQIQKGTVDPQMGIERIHREVVSPLEHPSDLQSWCFLWEGLNPMGNDVIPKDEYRAKIFEFAGKWLSEKGEKD